LEILELTIVTEEKGCGKYYYEVSVARSGNRDLIAEI